MWFKDRKSVQSQQKSKKPMVQPYGNVQTIENQRENFRIKIDTVALHRLRIGEKSTSWGQCTIADISVGGSRIVSNLTLPYPNPKILVQLQFDLESHFLFDALIVWGKEDRGALHYGLKWYNLIDLEKERLHHELTRLQIKKRKLITG